MGLKGTNKLWAVAVLMVVANFYFLPRVFALGTLTHASVLETGGTSNANPMIVGDGQALAIDFTTATATTGTTTITLTFTGWTGGTAGIVAATQTAPTAGACATLFSGNTPTAVPGALTAAGSGAVLTISGVSAMAASTNYCTTLPLVTAVTNPTAAGPYSVTITTSTDTQTISIDVLTAGANAYSITGTVAPTFTMSLSGTTDTLGALSSSTTIVSTGITATINTNAKSGWYMWAEDNSPAGLTSASNGHTIASVAAGSLHTMTTGSDQYALAATVDNTPYYAYGGGTTGGGLSATTFNEIATAAVPATGVTTVLHELVDISPTDPPGTDYTDVITLIGAGSF
jgi:hypothetical protein